MPRSSLLPLLLCSCAALAQSSRPAQQPAYPPEATDEMAVFALPPVQMGGTQDTASPPVAAPPQAHGPVRISGGVMAGLLINRVAPSYPAEARANRIGGAVVLAARIGADGTVQDLQVISGPIVLAGSAIDAVKHWIYRPYLLNGRPTEVNTTVTLLFNPTASVGSTPP